MDKQNMGDRMVSSQEHMTLTELVLKFRKDVPPDEWHWHGESSDTDFNPYRKITLEWIKD